MLQDEQVGRPEAEQHRGMAVEPIAEPAAPVSREIFAHRQRVDVAHAAPVEIARRRVMGGVHALPVIVRRQRHHADDPADPVVDRAAAEERPVAAIVLDHEQPHQKRGGRDRQRQAQPVADRKQRPHRHPQRAEREHGDRDLGEAAPKRGIAVAGQQPRQALGVGGGVRREIHVSAGHRRNPVESESARPSTNGERRTPHFSRRARTNNMRRNCDR